MCEIALLGKDGGDVSDGGRIKGGWFVLPPKKGGSGAGRGRLAVSALGLTSSGLSVACFESRRNRDELLVS